MRHFTWGQLKLSVTIRNVMCGQNALYVIVRQFI